MLQQFINEIKIQMFLDHPNIVKLYGCFDDATNFYILMEYMEGGNVFNLIKKAKKLTQQDTSERLKEICLGLKQMHDHSILHRDIKPQNIVITNVNFDLFRMFASFVILVGRLFARIGELLIAVLQTMCLLRLLKGRGMMIVWIFGVLECQLMR